VYCQQIVIASLLIESWPISEMREVEQGAVGMDCESRRILDAREQGYNLNMF
jgi:hypothetical protein